MKKIGMILGLGCILLGLCIMFTPMRIYFLLGWVTGIVFLFHGVPILASGVLHKPRIRNKIYHGATTVLIGITLLATDFLQILTQQFIVYIVAGGILISGLFECFVGYAFFKGEKKGLLMLLMGIISCVVGISGIIFQNATVMVIGGIIGFFLIKIGVSLFVYARDYDKPRVIDPR